MPLYRPIEESRRGKLTQAQGYITETIDRDEALTGTNTVSGAVYALPVYLKAGDIVTGCSIMCSNAGADVTLLKFGLKTTAGVLLAASADVKASLAVAELNPDFTAAYTVTSNGQYFVCQLTTWTTTATQFRGRGAVPTNVYGDLAEAPGAYEASQTDLDSTGTFVTTFATVNLPMYWIGLRGTPAA